MLGATHHRVGRKRAQALGAVSQISVGLGTGAPGARYQLQSYLAASPLTAPGGEPVGPQGG